MNLRIRIAYLICPALKAEIEALRDGNTRVVLENGRLLDKLASVMMDDDYIDLPDALVSVLSQKAQMAIANRRIRIRERKR